MTEMLHPNLFDSLFPGALWKAIHSHPLTLTQTPKLSTAPLARVRTPALFARNSKSIAPDFARVAHCRACVRTLVPHPRYRATHCAAQGDTHQRTVQSVDPTTGKFVFKRVWESGKKATKMELHQKDVHEGPDPAGSIASWDWSKNGGGGSYHDRSEDTNLDGRGGNEDGFHQTYAALPALCFCHDRVGKLVFAFPVSAAVLASKESTLVVLPLRGAGTIPTSTLCAGRTCTRVRLTCRARWQHQKSNSIRLARTSRSLHGTRESDGQCVEMRRFELPSCDAPSSPLLGGHSVRFRLGVRRAGHVTAVAGPSAASGHRDGDHFKGL